MLRSAFTFCSTAAHCAAALHQPPCTNLTHLTLLRAKFSHEPRDKAPQPTTASPNAKCAALCDDVERLSRGQATRHRIGSRSTGHRLNERERRLFEAAKRQHFLKMPASGARENVVNVYRLWCQMTGVSFDVRYTQASSGS